MARLATHPETWTLVGGFALVVVASIFFSFYLSWSAALVVAGALIFFIFVLKEPAWGVAVLALAAPMSGLVIDFSRNPSLARVPYIGSVSAPFVDFIAMALLVAAGALILFASARAPVEALRTHAGWFALWFLAVGLSVLFGEREFFGVAVKAFARPYVFAYVAFVVPVILFIRERRELIRALGAYEIAAAAGAVMGLVSIFILPVIGFPRAEPFSIFGFSPFGTNHNVLAESLVGIIPFAWWIMFRTENKTRKKIYFVAAFLISAVVLLTFSRAAWIVVAVQAVMAMFLWRKRWSFSATLLGAKKDHLFLHMKILLITSVLAGAILVVLIINNTRIAEGSDATRTDLTGIAITYFQRAPIFGQGPGTFVPLVAQTKTFKMDYGDPLDAHGVLQKVLTETGLVGTLVFGALIISLLYKLWKNRADELSRVMLVALSSVWMYQLFNTGYFLGKTWVLMGLALAALIL